MALTNMQSRNVSICRGNSIYPQEVPFHPSEKYPEYPFQDILSESNNAVYSQVRNALHLLALDKSNFGQTAWNPFGDLIEPGDYVLTPDGRRIGRLDHIFKDMVNIKECQIFQEYVERVVFRVVRGKEYTGKDKKMLLHEARTRLGNQIVKELTTLKQLSGQAREN